MNRRMLPTSMAALLAVAACGTPDSARSGADAMPTAERTIGEGNVVVVADTSVDALLSAAGIAAPIAQSTLSTRLMGTVVEVLVREGDMVAAGEPLVRLDARELTAKQEQVRAGIAEAEAVRDDADVQLRRIRGLHADSVATRAQLEAAETGFARAEAAVRRAMAGASELEAVSDYSLIRAPFAGMITKRFVDPGALAAPGAPLVAVADARRLRVTVTAAPEGVREVKRDMRLTALVEGRAVAATVEGVVPAPAGNVYTVNAIVDNSDGDLLAGSAATLQLPLGRRSAVVIPLAAVKREGDMTGVLLRGQRADELRWIRLGAVWGDAVEVLGGLRAGERIVMPVAVATAGGGGAATVVPNGPEG